MIWVFVYLFIGAVPVNILYAVDNGKLSLLDILCNIFLWPLLLLYFIGANVGKAASFLDDICIWRKR